MDDIGGNSLNVVNSDMKGSCGGSQKQRYMKLYQKCSDNFRNYLHLYKNSFRLVIREPHSNFCCVNKMKANDFIQRHHNVQVDATSCKKLKKKNDLTPLPYKSYKRVTSSKEQKDLISLERNAVVMRMIEYARNIKPNKTEVKNKYMNKLNSIIYIQKNIRGFLLRKTCNDIAMLYSKMESFMAHIKNYSLITAKHIHNHKNAKSIGQPNNNQNIVHKVLNEKHFVYNLRNISPFKTSNDNITVCKKSFNGKVRHNNIKLVKNVNRFIVSNSGKNGKQQVKPVNKKINKTHFNHKCLRFNKPPKKPICTKLNINSNISNSNSVLANYLNNCTSNVTEAYTPLNTNTNPTSKSTYRLSSKHGYSQHNCISFVFVPTKYVNSIGVQTVNASDENEHSLIEYGSNNSNSVIVNNPFNTYKTNTCLISRQKECLSSKERVSHMGMKCYNSLRVTQDKSFEIECCDGKKHNGMMTSFTLVSKINSIEFEYIPEVNVERVNIEQNTNHNNNHKEVNLSQLSIEYNNNNNNNVICNSLMNNDITQFPKELSDNSYTKITLHSTIHDIIASRVILIQNKVRQYLIRKQHSLINKNNSHIYKGEELNCNFICKGNSYLNSYLSKVVKIDLTKQINVIGVAVRKMLYRRSFYKKKMDPTLLAVALLIVKRFGFWVKFYVFRLLKRRYCYKTFQSDSMNTIKDDYDLNDERSKKLSCLFNKVLFDLKKDNAQRLSEFIGKVGGGQSITSHELSKCEVNSNNVIVDGKKSE